MRHILFILTLVFVGCQEERITTTEKTELLDICSILDADEQTQYQLHKRVENLKGTAIQTSCKIRQVYYNQWSGSYISCDGHDGVTYSFDAPENILNLNKGTKLCITGLITRINHVLSCFVSLDAKLITVGECKQ